MADIYKPTDWSVQQLVDAVGSGTLTLPDLQRPFVWSSSKIRDLLDSMYRGYPVGELMFWNHAGDVGAGAIGVDKKQQSSTHRIVDGQQRITSLYVAVTGQPVINSNYQKERRRISFNPFTERFEVATPAFDKSSEWVPDVADVFKSSLDAADAFVERYREVHGTMTDDQRRQVHKALGRIDGLRSRTFKVVELLPTVDKSVVADVFVRINSEGVHLKASDFILTWLSVFWPEGRDQMEQFARDSRHTADYITETTGTKTVWTPKNRFIKPDPGQLVRVAVAVGQKRGRLQDAYNALRALDRKTGVVDASKQHTELEKIRMAVPLVLDRVNWDEFLRILPAAGFRSSKMVTSDSAILATYALWLIGRSEHNVPLPELRSLMARWFFMAQISRRYSGSTETQIQQDIDRLDEAESAGDFVSILDATIRNVLTPDFWAIRLPDELVTSSAALSPAYQGYLAALNILDANLFMLHGRIRDWTDPSDTSIKNVETHHLYPRAYLKKLGYTDIKRINQAANYAPTDWSTNLLISDRAPSDYWDELVDERHFNAELLSQQMRWHAIPDDWTALTYDDFLRARRILMAQVVRDGYETLTDPTYQPELTATTDDMEDDFPAWTLRSLIEDGVLKPGDIIAPIDPAATHLAEITEDGEMLLDGKLFDDPTRAAVEVAEVTMAGWDYWALPTDDGLVPLGQLAASDK